MITENLSTLKIHNLTKEQYERELAAGSIDENALYLTPYEEMDLSAYATQEYVDDALADAGSIDIDLDASNEGEAALINADTLGGKLASEFATLDNIEALRQEILGGAW